jgi:NhaA family Na+:H+ antiporter
VAFLIMPLFALANSGVPLSGVGLEALTNRISLGAGLGLFLGKQLGIFLFTVLAVRLRLAPIPGGASRGKLYGVAMIAGIGFTVALFIARLAFPEPRLLDQAKIGILLGSLASGVVGFLILRLSAPESGKPQGEHLAPRA